MPVENIAVRREQVYQVGKRVVFADKWQVVNRLPCEVIDAQLAARLCDFGHGRGYRACGRAALALDRCSSSGGGVARRGGGGGGGGDDVAGVQHDMRQWKNW